MKWRCSSGRLYDCWIVGARGWESEIYRCEVYSSDDGTCCRLGKEVVGVVWFSPRRSRNRHEAAASLQVHSSFSSRKQFEASQLWRFSLGETNTVWNWNIDKVQVSEIYYDTAQEFNRLKLFANSLSPFDSRLQHVHRLSQTPRHYLMRACLSQYQVEREHILVRFRLFGFVELGNLFDLSVDPVMNLIRNLVLRSK